MRLPTRSEWPRRAALRRLLRQMLRAGSSDAQLAALLTALGLALPAAEVCLVERHPDDIHLIAWYSAWRCCPSLLALLEGVPREGCQEALKDQGALAVPVPSPDGAERLLVVLLRRGGGLGRGDAALIRAVAEYSGVLLAGPANGSATSLTPHPRQDGDNARSPYAWPPLRDLRRALRQLHYWVDLGRCPLSVLVAGDTAWERGEALHNLLLATIEEMRPATPDPDDPAWRQYVILEQHYVEARARPSLLPDLALSERQYQRELRRGIDALGVRLSWLWEQVRRQGGGKGI